MTWPVWYAADTSKQEMYSLVNIKATTAKTGKNVREKKVNIYKTDFTDLLYLLEFDFLTKTSTAIFQLFSRATDSRITSVPYLLE